MLWNAPHIVALYYKCSRSLNSSRKLLKIKSLRFQHIHPLFSAGVPCRDMEVPQKRQVGIQNLRQLEFAEHWNVHRLVGVDWQKRRILNPLSLTEPNFVIVTKGNIYFWLTPWNFLKTPLFLELIIYYCSWNIPQFGLVCHENVLHGSKPLIQFWFGWNKWAISCTWSLTSAQHPLCKVYIGFVDLWGLLAQIDPIQRNESSHVMPHLGGKREMTWVYRLNSNRLLIQTHNITC